MTLLEKKHQDWLKQVWLENSEIFQSGITCYLASRVSPGINEPLAESRKPLGFGGFWSY